MALNVARTIAELQRQTMPALRRRYAELFGESTAARNKAWLIKRIAWRLQALDEGDLSQRARQRAEELAQDADLRVTAPTERLAKQTFPAPAPRTIPMPADRRLPLPGTILTRSYKDRTLAVTVLDQGFEFEGQRYASLSAVAQAATGAHWSGFRFFGLLKKTGGRAS